MKNNRLKLLLACCAGLLGGCAWLASDPVPPPPPPPPQIELMQGKVPDEISGLVKRDTKGAVTGFKPLAAARDAVNQAAASPEVANYAQEPLAQAQTALKQAEQRWQAIAAAPLADPQALAEAAHAAHTAKRWGQIAREQARREVGLRALAQTHNQRVQRDAENAHWQGKQLVPGELGRLRFAVGTATLSGDSRAVIQRLAKFMQDHPQYQLRIAGYTDNTAPSAANLDAFLAERPEVASAAATPEQRAAAYNLAMSKRRAQAVRKALEAAGIAAERLSVQGYGSAHPVADNDTAAGRRHNRRVEVTVVP